MRPELLAPLLLLVALAAACGRGSERTATTLPAAGVARAIAGVDLSQHSVPLQDIHFDTFAGTSIPLSRITEAQYSALRDAIPPLTNPKYDDIAGGAWLREDDLVVGYVAGNDAYAYPLKLLNFHEIVNDELQGVPVLVTYCPLCRSGIVYDRRLGGRTLTFGNTSALYETDLVMYDHQTNSFWWQTAGAAIVGTLTGQRLTPLPSITATWSQWQKLHPDTKVLSLDTGFARPYARDPFAGYAESVNSGRFPFPVSEAAKDGRLAAADEVLGLTLGGESKAYPLRRLGDIAVNDVVGGQRVVVLSAAKGPSGAAFLAQAAGLPRTFAYRGGKYLDLETGSEWNLSGRAVSGPLKGMRLEPVPSRYTFWFAYIAAFPEAEVYKP